MIRIEIDGKVDWLGKCVAAEAIAFSLLRDRLLELEAEYEDPYFGLNDPAIRWTIEQLYHRLPSLLGEKLLSVDRLWAYEDLVLNLFWGNDAKALVEVSQPPQSSPVEGNDEYKLEEPTSGDAFVDLFAKLILVDNTVDGAVNLLHRYSLDTLIHLTRQLGELRRPHEERMKEAQAKYLQDTIANAKEFDPTLYHQILGLGAPKPL